VGGYLTRLVTRDSAPQTMRPSLRSTSPIADKDQRIGIFDTQNAPFEEAPVPPIFDEAIAPPPHVSMPAPTPTSVMAPPVRPSPNFAHVRSIEPVSRQISALPAQIHVPSVEADDTAAASISPPKKSADLLTTRLIPPKEVLGRTHEVTRREETRSDDSLTRKIPWPLNPPSATERSSPREGSTQRLDFVPRPSPSPRVIESGRDDNTAENPMDERPTVTIGSIHVEVVPTSVETPPSTPTRPTPVTAASVSVIGPLSGRVPSNRRLSLRYR
jgi:hypothetical protein